MRYNVPKGLYDIVPTETKEEDQWKTSHRWHYLEDQLRNLCQDFAYREIRTPIFERTELFVRGAGEGSDIVSKEMYTFEDKGKRSMTLRPEGTAPVMRAFVEKGLQQLGSYHKLFYIGPYFRYDRPQAGRYRQFQQFGVEAIGNGTASQDIEIMAMLGELFTRLELKEWTLLLNTVGDSSCRGPYRDALRDYLRPHFDQLSDDSKVRFEKNPLRILDSKDPTDRKLLEGAPSIHEFLSDASKAHFDQVCEGLAKLSISFKLETNLVRGLDYYNQTVFEITAPSLGSQNSIGGGGRFDGLMKQLGGQDLPSTGFALGLERLLITMAGQQCPIPDEPGPFIYIIPLVDATSHAHALRSNRIPTDISPTQSVKKGLQLANQAKATYALVLGEDEIASNSAKLKHLAKHEETPVDLRDLTQTCKRLYEQ